ncbi:Anthranilate phosphoribosyltransferase [Tuber indicum]|nr:Anthranilate phosphoribosyltransferase [Tuber indicum]
MAEPKISILSLLKALSESPDTISPEDITKAITHSFNDELSPVQTGTLLTTLHFTKLDQKPEIIAAAARAMRAAGLKVDGLRADAWGDETSEGKYGGGLVDIVGTGGDGHNTFNVSTTSAILASGCGLRICKHGNKASTSASGSADILTSLGAKLIAITPSVVASIFNKPSRGNFCFLYAPVFHPAVRHVAPIRRELGHRTIFNLLGPLANPIDYSVPGGLEARIIGVGRRELGQVFAETLKILGASKGMVVCGEEGLDEVSCERRTECWRLLEDPKTKEIMVDHFFVHPTETFGIPTHSLSKVAGGKGPDENAAILERLLKGQAQDDEKAVKDFVLVNTAALIAISGLLGPVERVPEGTVAKGAVWKNAVEKANEGIASGKAWEEWSEFVEKSRQAEVSQAWSPT